MFDNDAKVKILDLLQASTDPESRAAVELIRVMDAAVGHLADALSCSIFQADGSRQPCSFQVRNEECSCERCGQLLSEWELQAAAALEYALPDAPQLEDETKDLGAEIFLADSPENLKARADRVQALFGELEHVFSGLSLPSRVAQPISPGAASGIRCEGCGAPISDQVKFCPRCGRTAQGRHCLSCNAVLDRDMNFCPSCGAKAA